MINRQDACLSKLVVHHIGNEANHANLRFAPECHMLDDLDLNQILISYFLDQYKVPEFYQFSANNGDFSRHPLHGSITKIFNDSSLLYEESKKIALHLFEQISHLHETESNVYLASIQNILLEDEYVEAIAIVRADEKDSFLNVDSNLNKRSIKSSLGTSIAKMVRGCLILNTEKSTGYKILCIDQAKGIAANIWRNEFLSVTPYFNSYRNTTEFIKLTAGFIKNNYTNEDSPNILEEAEYLQKTLDYVKQNDQISIDDYKDKVLKTSRVMEAFDLYTNDNNSSYSNANERNKIEVSELALKQYAKVYKSVLKLDKNFHVYIHGDHSKISRGVDEFGRKYYQLYYEEES